MTRANHLSSSGVERAKEEKQVTEALRSNGYPSGFIHKHTTSGRGREEVEDQKLKTTLTLPYICGLSETIRRVLSHLEVKVVFRPMRTLQQLLGIPKTQSQLRNGKEWCTQTHAWIIQKCTLVRLEGA